MAAEKAGMVTAAYYFVGTEADIQGVPMTYWHAFDASVPGPARVKQVVEWLSLPDEKRPHFITLYFEDVDTMTHAYGPGSPQTVKAVERVDRYLGALMAGIGKLPIADDVYIVVVSDHGLLDMKLDDEILVIDEVVDLDGLAVVDHGAAAYIYFAEPDQDRAVTIRDAINAHWRHGTAMLRAEAPGDWHVTAEAGFADIIVQARTRLPGLLDRQTGTAQVPRRPWLGTGRRGHARVLCRRRPAPSPKARQSTRFGSWTSIR